MKWLVTLIILSGCGLNHAPPVYIDSHNTLVIKAVEAWDQLGFTFTPVDLGLGECDRTWYSDTFESECQITISVKFVDDLTDDDVNGAEIRGRANHDTRLVEINTYLHDVGLQHTLTHEIGHILLDSNHLESYQKPEWDYGVMSNKLNNILTPTEDDYALACYTIGVCVMDDRN